MASVDLGLDDEPPADIAASAVLTVLVGSGRWADAADFYPAIDDPAPIGHAQYLIAASRPDEANAILAGTPRDEDEPWEGFVRQVNTVLRGRRAGLPDLIAAAARIPDHPLAHVLMLRAADAAGDQEVAAHYARLLQQHLPGDIEAARAQAVALVRRGEYIDAVRAIDRAQLTRCRDEPDPLQLTLDRLSPTGSPSPEAVALVTIGQYLHRVTDPSQPAGDAARAGRVLWRSAYRRNAPRNLGYRALLLGATALGAAGALLVGNGLPIIALAVALRLWRRVRPLPGLDLRTSRLVRAISNPLQIVYARRYRPMDVLTFLLAAGAAGAAVAQLPGHPSWLDPVKVVLALLIAAACVRGRRRLVRRERASMQPSALPPDRCCCLDLTSVHGEQSRAYVEQHLFPAGVVPGAPQWHVRQCLGTHTSFLDIPSAWLTLRLPAPPPRHLAWRSQD